METEKIEQTDRQKGQREDLSQLIWGFSSKVNISVKVESGEIGTKSEMFSIKNVPNILSSTLEGIR